jgi:hypothetical protein
MDQAEACASGCSSSVLVNAHLLRDNQGAMTTTYRIR